MAVPNPKIWISFGSAALAGLFALLLCSGQGSALGEVAVPATRGDSPFVAQVDYIHEFEGTCNPVTVTVHFQSVVAGGEPPYHYAWYFGDGGASSDPNPSHTYTSISIDYTIVLQVTDSGGAVAMGSLVFRPPPPPCASQVGVSPLGIPGVALAIVVAAMAVATVLVVSFARFQRNRKP